MDKIMTANEIEKKLNYDLDLYEVVEISYDEANKDLYLWIWIDLSDCLVKLHSTKLSAALKKYGLLDMNILNNTPLTEFPKYELKVINDCGIFRTKNETPISNEIGKQIYDSLEFLFLIYFQQNSII